MLKSPSTLPRSLACTISSVILSAASVQAATVTVPFSEDFSDTSKTTAAAFLFTHSVGGLTNIVGSGDARRMQILLSASQNGHVSVDHALTGPNDFTVSSSALPYVLDTEATTAPTIMRFALVASGTGSNLHTSDAYRVSLDFIAGTVSLLKGTGTSFTSLAAAFTGNLPTFSPSTTLSMSLAGTYLSATSVLLTGEVSDGTNTYSFTYTDTDALAGAYYGFHGIKNGTSSGTDTERSRLGVQVDNFQLDVVPEPSSALLAAAGLFAFSTRRRRQE